MAIMSEAIAQKKREVLERSRLRKAAAAKARAEAGDAGDGDGTCQGWGVQRPATDAWCSAHLKLVQAQRTTCYPAREPWERGGPLGFHDPGCRCGWCQDGGMGGRCPVRLDGLLSVEACDALVATADACAADVGGWAPRTPDRGNAGGTKHRRYATTDVALERIEARGDATYRAALRDTVLPAVAAIWRLDPRRLGVSEAFVVKYSAGAQNSLDLHTDSSRFSLNILLSAEDAFAGGGTYFEALDRTEKPRQGGALIHEGDLKHRGMPITAGDRYILVAFIEYDTAE